MRPLVACLCPTYGRPALVENSVGLFLDQTWPLPQACMYVLDDGGQLPHETRRLNDGRPWLRVITTKTRFPSLSSKYTALLTAALEDGATDLAIWDDDDVYLPSHLARAMEGMNETGALWSKPSRVWSTYSNPPIVEKADGRFWGSVVLSVEGYRKMGGLVSTERADFDQLNLQRMSTLGPPFDPGPTYVFRWSDTGHPHAQHFITKPSDREWYHRMARPNLPPHAKLVPEVDARTRELIIFIESHHAHVAH